MPAFAALKLETARRTLEERISRTIERPSKAARGRLLAPTNTIHLYSTSWDNDRRFLSTPRPSPQTPACRQLRKARSASETRPRSHDHPSSTTLNSCAGQTQAQTEEMNKAQQMSVLKTFMEAPTGEAGEREGSGTLERLRRSDQLYMGTLTKGWTEQAEQAEERGKDENHGKLKNQKRSRVLEALVSALKQLRTRNCPKKQ
ncbi:hypothetical protein HDU96_007088 [Phlyctochytrium bullatum]|nr:hypothetical protein HDU96_007088 [Phlyctochytrium bullatum]